MIYFYAYNVIISQLLQKEKIMLIRFRVSNFLSFKEEIEFSMVPGKSRHHPNHIISGGNSRSSIDLLRSTIFYGANASGKSNLVKAIGFAQELIINGAKSLQQIPVTPFKLDPDLWKKPSKFEFEIRTSGKDYLYGFEVTSEKIVSEWLYELKLTTKELLFKRGESPEHKTIVEFGKFHKKSKNDDKFLDFVARGTRINQLFLNEIIGREIDIFKPVYLWFIDSLTLVFPESRYKIFEQNVEEKELFSQYLSKFNTGICDIVLKPVLINDDLQRIINNKIINDLSIEQKKDCGIALVRPHGQRLFLSKNNKGEFIGHELAFKHKMGGCENEIVFNLSEESDGSIRLLDLIPILFKNEKKGLVYLIDELDRSLHPNLCYELIELFLKNESENTQLIATTHESNLLDLDLLRRDEIWFIEKDNQGASNIYSLEEFTPRYDKDIQKGYLLGRFGAIPMIGKSNF